jgi:lysophosphatidylcholine acyltransferase/lyso-PAF acetyltransferase
LEKITERQKQIYEGTADMPLLIFPEGTISSGRCLLEFKKGAFDGLYPLKPYIIRNRNRNFDLSGGSINLLAHVFIFLSHLWHNIEVMELPILSPNEFMFSNSGNPKIEKWEIYANTAKSIMSEIGDLEKSTKSFKENLEYSKKLYNK